MTCSWPASPETTQIRSSANGQILSQPNQVDCQISFRTVISAKNSRTSYFHPSLLSVWEEPSANVGKRQRQTTKRRRFTTDEVDEIERLFGDFIRKKKKTPCFKDIQKMKEVSRQNNGEIYKLKIDNIKKICNMNHK